MADGSSFSEDITGLWGAPDESALEPPRPNGAATNGRPPQPAPVTGAHAEIGSADTRDKVARLADALAGHPVDVVRHSELGALRTEMEDAFAQKLAVALYELLSASNERFSSVEDHVERCMREVAAELRQSIKAQTDRLAVAIDTQQRMTADIARAARDELSEISDRFSAPLNALTAFEREVRHEVGRIGDLVAAHNADAARRSEDAAEAGAALSRRLDGCELRDAAASESLETVTASVESVQSDVTELRDAMQALREEVSALRGRAGARRRWGRSG